MVTKAEVEANKILQRIHDRNPDYGGVFSQTTGAQGSSKTSILLAFTRYTQKYHPKEKIFWSENYRSPLQTFKLGKGNYQFYVKEGSNVVFRNRDKRLRVENLGEEYFKDYDELYDIAKPGIANVVFTGDRLNWMEFIEYLSGVGQWTNVFLDEMGDVCPAMTANPTWSRIGKFVETAKAIRRCMLNVHYNSQSIVDIDFRVVAKVMIKIYLPGARADKHGRVTQGAIDNLKLDPVNGNQAWMEFFGKFGKTRFSDIFKPLPGYHYEAFVQK